MRPQKFPDIPVSLEENTATHARSATMMATAHFSMWRSPYPEKILFVFIQAPPLRGTLSAATIMIRAITTVTIMALVMTVPLSFCPPDSSETGAGSDDC